MNRTLTHSLLLILVIISKISLAQNHAEKHMDAPVFDSAVVFSPEMGNYATTRIPALVMTTKGTLLAFCEARISGKGDWASIDLVFRRSTDGGKHWDTLKTLVKHDTAKPTTSNITPIVGKDGTIHLLFQRNYARVYYMRSTDDGRSWSAPADITYAFNAFKNEYNWEVVAPGPGHAIILRSGRLLVPVWMSVSDGKGAHRPSCIATVYSDNNGQTWHRGNIVVNHGDIIAASGDTVINPSENVAIELADGRVLLNMRTEASIHRRLISYSKDGGINWSKPEFDKELFEPVCMASLIRVSGNGLPGRNRILFVNPDSRNNMAMLNVKNNFRRRENLTAKLSYTEGKTWDIVKILDVGESGYSDLAIDNRDGNIYCLHEATVPNKEFWTQRIVLRTFNLEWLTNGQDSYNKTQ